MSAQLPNCPTCDTPVHRSESVGGYVSYACDNEACEQFPATGFLEQNDARKEWLLIAAPRHFVNDLVSERTREARVKAYRKLVADGKDHDVALPAARQIINLS